MIVINTPVIDFILFSLFKLPLHSSVDHDISMPLILKENFDLSGRDTI